MLVGLVSALALASIAVELSAYRKSRARPFRTPSRINRFMYEWISQRGKVAIFSNDMSWVSDDIHSTVLERLAGLVRQRKRPTIYELLAEKAAKQELVLCLPRPTDLARDLEQRGATVATYASLGVVPESRFTIVRAGQQDAEVAIGRRVAGVHRIETFSKGHHPVYSLAEDLVEYVMALAPGERQ